MCSIDSKLYQEIKEISLDVLNTKSEIKPESYLIRDLNIDSISFFFILAKIEQNYSIQIEIDSIYLKEDDYTFEKFVILIQSYIK